MLARISANRANKARISTSTVENGIAVTATMDSVMDHAVNNDNNDKINNHQKSNVKDNFYSQDEDEVQEFQFL